MEPYIPLVKAIIISTMFSWGTSSVVITDQYIFKEISAYDHDSGNQDTSYRIINLKTNMVHAIFEEMGYQIVQPIHPVDPRIKYALESTDFQATGETDTTFVKEDFGEFKCKKEEIRIVSSTYQPEVGAELNNYFAKIPWLDKILNTKEKREFAGFERQEFSPYHYLIYTNIQYPNQAPEDHLLRIIEKKDVDTTLIHTLLNLPIRNN